jgi:hypothetical protein
MLTEQEVAQAITITLFDHEYTAWTRDIDFEWQGQEQHVILTHSDGEGYDIVEQTLTDDFEEWLDKNQLSLDRVLDDLTWQLVK